MPLNKSCWVAQLLMQRIVRVTIAVAKQPESHTALPVPTSLTGGLERKQFAAVLQSVKMARQPTQMALQEFEMHAYCAIHISMSTNLSLLITSPALLDVYRK
jgi:hypothetical protein